MMKIKDIIFIVIILALAYFTFKYFTNPQVVRQIEVKADTLVFTAAPDTIWKTRVRIDTRIDTLVNTDTVYVVKHDTVYTFVSLKQFDRPYLTSIVRAYAPCPVDSFSNKITVRWDDWYNDNIKPEMKRMRRQSRWNQFKTFMIGMAAGAGTVAILK